MLKKIHNPKFTIEKRGKKSKYYTCEVCKERFVATSIKKAKEYHLRFLLDK